MIISVASIKGGVGKSCSVISIGGALAQSKKKTKVLIVDFDASAAATHSLSYNFPRFRASLFDIFEKKFDVDQAIHQYSKSLHFIPTATNWGSVSEKTLTKHMPAFIKKIQQEYDYVLFDLAPAIFFGSIVPLSYSDAVIIPVQAKGGLSLLGLDAQMEIIADLHQQGNEIDVLGIFATFVNRTKLSREVVSYLQRECKDEFLSTTIRENTSLAQAASMGKTIFDHRPNSNGAKDYTKLTKELLLRIKNRKG